MKNLLVLFVVLLSSIHATQAQVSIGIRAGLNTTHSQGSSDFSIGSPFAASLRGWSATIPVRFQLSKNFSLQPELSFFDKKRSYNFKYFDTSFKLKNELSYLELPVLASFRLIQKERFSLNLLVGPSISYKLREGGNLTIDQAVKNQDAIDLVESYQHGSELGYSSDWDYKGILGFNMLFNVKQHLFSFDIRYNYEYSGLLNSYNSEHHQDLDISVGYVFPLK